MTPKSRMARLVGLIAVGLLVSPFVVAAQTGESLGTVRLPQSVMANGQALAAGTYTARLSTENVSRVVGQPADSTRWVEFVQGGQVKGRELATVVAPADVKAGRQGHTAAPGHSANSGLAWRRISPGLAESWRDSVPHSPEREVATISGRRPHLH